MPLTSVDRVLAWTKKDTTFDPSRQDELIRCIAAASDLLAGIVPRQLERVTRSISLDGCDATGRGNTILRLPRGDRPVLHTGSDLITVAEDGVSLALALGHSTSAGAIIRGANKDAQCDLVRNGSGWAEGVQNILVGYKCGWTLDAPNDPQPVPARVIQLANTVTWMIFQEAAWLGKLNIAAQGAAVTLSDELPELERETLRNLMGL
jgi:hypothetical protein